MNTNNTVSKAEYLADFTPEEAADAESIGTFTVEIEVRLDSAGTTKRMTAVEIAGVTRYQAYVELQKFCENNEVAGLNAMIFSSWVK